MGARHNEALSGTGHFAFILVELAVGDFEVNAKDGLEHLILIQELVGTIPRQVVREGMCFRRKCRERGKRNWG